MKKHGRLRRKFEELNRSVTLSRLMLVVILAILINAFLMTSTSYMLMLRTGFMKSLMTGTFWPLLLVLLCVCFAILLTAFFVGQKLTPLNKVNEAMKQVARGDFSVRVDESSCVGEMHDLVASYNHMAQELGGIEMFRTDFINNFSHEFKTPIVSIRGFARQLERDDLSEDERREYARIIATESERLARMSANVLLLTKLEKQQIITDKESYRLDEQLRNCILLLEKQWEDKNIEMQPDLDEISYEGNEEMMSHIWVNLLNNAIKFSDEGGVIEVGCMRVQSFIVVHVTDHGRGMDEVTRTRIFEKFYQGDSAHATEGNGLGLALVKRIVDLCSRKITVTSAPGEGSCFSVYLPVEE